MKGGLGRSLLRLLLGERPRSLAALLVPTGLAVLLDAALRGGLLLAFAPQGKLIYGSSLLISAALWGWPLWGFARLRLATQALAGTRRIVAGLALVALVGAWVFPFATLGYGGQALYHRVFHGYMGRDTLRLGIALRGTVTDWFVAWGTRSLLGGMLLVGAAVSFGVLWTTRRVVARPLSVPWLLPVTFVAALGCLWFDQLDSRFLQAATPDTCLLHGVVHALRVRLSGQAWVRKGVSLRSPLPLPPLTAVRAEGATRLPNVVVVLTESVRADALCSAVSPRCDAPFLDAVVPDRLPLGLLTSQTPNTFSAFLVLTTGLSPSVDFRTAHEAPVLWELARAVGYTTAYVSAQNPKYEDFGTFVERAGIDHLVTGTDLGGLAQEQIGAPDERATEETLHFLEAATRAPGGPPYFAVVHLSNTHAPYRDNPGLQPYQPSASAGLGDVTAFHNHYRNSVRLQERTVAAFLRDVKALPGWDDTAVVFLSDHGEQFREHGGLFHNHSLFDEELRVPGFVVAGNNVLTRERRAALATYAGQRVFPQDVHATLVDLFGLHDAEKTLPHADVAAGRSLLRPRPTDEPAALLATSTAVWEPDDARYGVMKGDRVLVSSAQRSWICFDLKRDPGEHTPLPAASCGSLLEAARSSFAGVDVPAVSGEEVAGRWQSEAPNGVYPAGRWQSEAPNGVYPAGRWQSEAPNGVYPAGRWQSEAPNGVYPAGRWRWEMRGRLPLRRSAPGTPGRASPPSGSPAPRRP